MEWATGKRYDTGKKLRKPPEAPFVWHMATVCLEMPYGAVRHIPAGSYHEQMATWTGEVELRLMRLAHTVWFAFKHMKRSDWKAEQTELLDWIKTQPPPIPPTHRMNAFIAHVWRATDWGLKVYEDIRRKIEHD